MKETITNPVTIMLINMTIVFAVLYSLGWIIKLIRYIDPTKPKEAPKPALEAAPVAAPAASAVSAQQEDDMEIAAVIAAALAANEDDLEIAAAIAAALAVYGCQVRRIVSVSPAQSWTGAARLEAVNTRSQMC